ncbi:MAG: hypothetical protein QW063_01815 [Candidatus Nanoarchaeia archaeon]
MPLVDACKALSDPQKIGRIYSILEPLLIQPIKFKAKAKRCNKLLEEAKRWSEKPRVVGALKSYKYLNEAIFARLPSLKDYEIIFITSESKDPNMGYACTSIFSEFFTLGDRILQMEQELYDEFGPSKKQIVYFPVAPVLFPAATAYENDKVVLKFPFLGIFEEINSKLPPDQSVSISDADLVRRLNQDTEGQKGIYQFKTLLFYPDAAKSVFVDRDNERIKEQEQLLEDCTYVIKGLLGNAYKNICDRLDMEEPIPLYTEEGGYAAKVFEAGGIKFTTFGQVTRSSKAKIYGGTSSDSAIRILKSAIHNVRYGGMSFYR